jgi:hypothetical protein
MLFIWTCLRLLTKSVTRDSNMRMAGFGGNLIQWFDSYLTNRQQRVTVLGATSTTLPVTSGGPQGCKRSSRCCEIQSSCNVRRRHKTVFNHQNWKWPGQPASLVVRVWPLVQRQEVQSPTHHQKIHSTNNNVQTIVKFRTNWVLVQNNFTWNKQLYDQLAKANKLLGYIRRSMLYIHNTTLRNKGRFRARPISAFVYIFALS